jgi:hypothetical protein
MDRPTPFPGSELFLTFFYPKTTSPLSAKGPTLYASGTTYATSAFQKNLSIQPHSPLFSLLVPPSLPLTSSPAEQLAERKFAKATFHSG